MGGKQRGRVHASDGSYFCSSKRSSTRAACDRWAVCGSTSDASSSGVSCTAANLSEIGGCMKECVMQCAHKPNHAYTLKDASARSSYTQHTAHLRLALCWREHDCTLASLVGSGRLLPTLCRTLVDRRRAIAVGARGRDRDSVLQCDKRQSADSNPIESRVGSNEQLRAPTHRVRIGISRHQVKKRLGRTTRSHFQTRCFGLQ